MKKNPANAAFRSISATKRRQKSLNRHLFRELEVKDANLSKIRELLDMDADVNAKDATGMTPLMWAARMRALDAARLLLDRGAEVNAVNADGYPPLAFVCWGGKAEDGDLARLLVDRGADLFMADKKGRTVYDWAVANDNHAMIAILEPLCAAERKRRNDHAAEQAVILLSDVKTMKPFRLKPR